MKWKYGFVNFALEELVLRNFGEEIWSKIKLVFSFHLKKHFIRRNSNFFNFRKEAGVEVDGHFMIRVIYNDDATYALVTAAAKILSKEKFELN